MPTMTEDNWFETRAEIRRRRLELGLLQREVCAAAGLSMATWTQLEHGPKSRFAERTLIAASRALGWTDDSIHILLGGGRAVARPGAVQDELADVRATVVSLLRTGNADDADVADSLGEYMDDLDSRRPQVPRAKTDYNSRLDSLTPEKKAIVDALLDSWEDEDRSGE